jgi:hypothetical protein
LLTGLAAIFAAAGAGARLRVVAWEDGFAVGGHRLERLGPSPHAFLVAAPLEAGSLAAAARAAAGLPPDRTWLVLDGDLPRLDPVLGIGEVAARLPPGRVVRLPLLGRREMEALARRAEPCMARRSSGMRHLELARALAHAYLEQQR